jgi:hypothetical protein
MRKEVLLQHDMFSGEWVDTRTPKQKRKASQHQARQMEMFSQRELAQFGVRARPKLPISPKTALELAMVDYRTEEEKDADRMKAAQDNTHPMFERTSLGPANTPLLEAHPSDDETETRTWTFPSGLTFALVEVEEPEPDIAVQLTDEVNVLMCSTRDAEYARCREQFWPQGHRVYRTSNDQLELSPNGAPGTYLITYSDMEMVENVDWVEERQTGK